MPTPHALTQHLKVTICLDGEDATKKGFVYREPHYKAIRIEHAVVVQRGTVNGNSTVDLILVDEHGNKFMTMIPGNLLRTIPL